MNQSKILSNSLFQIITALSLIAGLLLLSFSGNPFTLLEPPEPDIETPETLEDQELENNTFAERVQQQLQEQDIDSPEQDIPNLENDSFLDRAALGILERLVDTNQTLEEEQEIEHGEEQETDEGQAGEEESVQEDSEQQQEEQNEQEEETEESGQEEQEQDEQDQEQEEESEELEQEDSEREETQQEEKQEEQEGKQEIDEPDEAEEEEDEEAETSGITEKIEDRSKSILTVLIIIATVVAALLVYISDADIREISRTIIQKLKSFIKTLPDATQRMLLNIVNITYSTINRIIVFAKELVTKPVQKTKQTIKTAKNSFNGLKNWFVSLKQNGLDSQASNFLGRNEKEYNGLMAAWMTLKARAGLKGQDNYTPEEVREKALENQLPQNTVNKLVEIFRVDKYSSQDYKDSENPENLKKDLERKDEQDR